MYRRLSSQEQGCTAHTGSVEGPFEALPGVSSAPTIRDVKSGSRATDRAALHQVPGGPSEPASSAQ